jgi:membrane protease YdiL (CAAX protease family)
VPEPDLAPGPHVAGNGAGATAAPLPEPQWGIGEALVGWLASLVGGVIMSQIVFTISGEDFEDWSLGLVAVAQTGLWAGLFGAPYLAARFKGNGLVRDFGLRWSPRDLLPDVLNGGFWGLFSQWVLIPLLYVPVLLLTDVDGNDLSEAARDLTDRASGAFSVVMLVLIVGIGAPIFEEIFYRGLVLRSVEKRFGTVVAVISSGIFFGISHLNAPLLMPGLAVFGIVLGVLTVRSGRLWPAIAAHLAFNMATVVAMLT